MTAVGSISQTPTLDTAVREFMTPHPLTMSDRAPLSEAQDFMIVHQISAVPVVNDDGRTVGVLSRTDLIRHAASSCGYQELAEHEFFGSEFEMADVGWTHMCEMEPNVRVHEVMTPDILSVRSDASAREAIRLMLDRHIHRVFVKDDTGALVGVVTACDIFRWLIKR